MRLIMQGHRNRFELENVIRLFLPQEKVRTEGERLFADEPDVLAGLEKGPSATRVTVRLQADGFDRTIIRLMRRNASSAWPTPSIACWRHGQAPGLPGGW